MKQILLIILIFFISYCIQGLDLPLDEETGKVTYSDIRKIEPMTKDELYAKTIEWFAYRFNSSNDVIQLADKVKMKVIGKGNFKINFYAKNPVISFTISVFLKESRYKIIITDLKYKDKKGLEFIIHDDNFPKYWGGKKKLYNAVDIEIKSILEDFFGYMNTPEDEDW
jgi:hypothetical protein